MAVSGTEHALLAVPARARLVELVRAADEPVTVHELAEAVDLHVTTVRFHLDLLVRAGLLVAEPLPAAGRGRPRIGYRPGLVDLAQVREQMIEALARALADREPRDRAVVAGRRWAERLPLPDEDPTTAVAETFSRLGFAPDPEPDGDTIWLRACPFADAARQTPQVVCRVHLGLAQGIATRRAAPGRRPDVDLVPFAEPDACRLTIANREPASTARLSATTRTRPRRTTSAPAPSKG